MFVIPVVTPQPLFSSRRVVALAWTVMLLVSTLPDVLWREGLGRPASALFWPKLALLALVVGIGLLWAPLRPLRGFAVVLCAVYAASELFARLAQTPAWQGWFGGGEAPFATTMMGIQLQRLAVALSVLAVLRLLGYTRRGVYLTPGRLDAPAAPVPWLGIRRAEPWTRFGRNFAVFISLGTLAFLFMAGRPSAAALSGILPLLPAVLLLAAMNAFSEEFSYRAALLATLREPLGPGQALWLSALFFGLGHYYGVPYGVVGVVMATFLGWLLGKAMLETKGLFWAWFIHFLQDVWIFGFMASNW